MLRGGHFVPILLLLTTLAIAQETGNAPDNDHIELVQAAYGAFAHPTKYTTECSCP